jgi:hypothetical protein
MRDGQVGERDEDTDLGPHPLRRDVLAPLGVDDRLLARLAVGLEASERASQSNACESRAVDNDFLD